MGCVGDAGGAGSAGPSTRLRLAQGLVSGISNSITTAIVGSLLCVAYAATKTKAGSLTKE